jgi:hypothetical protein
MGSEMLPCSGSQNMPLNFPNIFLTHSVYTCPEPMFESEHKPVGGLVGRVMCLLCLASPLDWCISLLLEHVSHQVPGLTESEATIPVKVLGVKPDLSSLLYHMVHISCCLIQVVFTVSNLCSITADFSGWPRHMYHMFQWFCQSLQHTLCHTCRGHSIYLQLSGPFCLL